MQLATFTWNHCHSLVRSRAITLIFLYLLFSLGAVVHFHYCGETFDHFTVFVQPENCCDPSCCHNSSFELKVKDDQEDSNLLFISAAPVLMAIPPSSGFCIEQFFQEEQKISLIDTGPLIHSGKYPIYLANRVFLI
jgi:hypothetical protein